jgi:hypothetical protein
MAEGERYLLKSQLSSMTSGQLSSMTSGQLSSFIPSFFVSGLDSKDHTLGTSQRMLQAQEHIIHILLLGS